MRTLATFLLLALLSAPTASAQTILSDTRSTPYGGIELRRGDVRLTNGETTSYDAAYVSLCTSYVHVAARAPATTRRTTGSWGAAVGAQLAVNGDFFRNTSGNEHVYGDAVGFGSRWPAINTGNAYSGDWYYHDYGWIAFGPDWVEFSHSRYVKRNAEAFGATLGWRPDVFTEDIPAGTLALVSGFSELVIEGTPYTCPDPMGNCFPDRGDMAERHPRTAMGISEDRRTFLLATVDGRNGRTAGVTGAELAQIMYDLGAWEAINLDGGGSSSLWTASGGYQNYVPTARAVMNHWGVFAGAASGQPESPGHCFTAGGCYPTAVAGAEDEDFGDLAPGALGHEEASILLRAGVTNGCRTSPRRMFCPSCEIDRRQFIVLLVKAAGIPHPSVATSRFDDVADDDWAIDFIEAGADAGIISGCMGGTSFCPDNPVLRRQAAAFLTRATGWVLVRPETPTYSDVPTDHTFYAAIETITEYCVDSGCAADRFCPGRAMTRAEVAVFLARAFNMEGINACLVEECNAIDDDFDGAIDEGCPPPAMDGGTPSSDGGAASLDASAERDAGAPPRGDGGTGPRLGSSCDCRAGAAPSRTVTPWWGLVGLMLLARRRRRETRSV